MKRPYDSTMDILRLLRDLDFIWPPFGSERDLMALKKIAKRYARKGILSRRLLDRARMLLERNFALKNGSFAELHDIYPDLIRVTVNMMDDPNRILDALPSHRKIRMGDGGTWMVPLTVSNAYRLESAVCIAPGLRLWMEDQGVVNPLPHLPNLRRELYPFQHHGVEYIEAKNGRALVADEMGLGKTIQALGWASIHRDKRPIVVVCPASIKHNWVREVKLTLNAERCYVCESRSPDSVNRMQRSTFIIINYDILPSWVKVLKKLEPKILIVDEVHYIKTASAKRTEAVLNLGQSIPHVIALSGTPIVNNPAEIWTTIHLLDEELFPSFRDFAFRYCDPKRGYRKMEYKGAEHMEELHKILTTTVMIRRSKAEVLKELPPKVRTVIPFPLTGKDLDEYRMAEQEFTSWLAQEITDPRKLSNSLRAQALVKTGYLKRLCARAKLKQVTEWIEEYLELEEKLVVFGIHHVVMDFLKDRYPESSMITGSVPNRQRQVEVDRFQRDPKVRLFLGNIQAAGVGITLTAAKATSFVELGWTPGEHRQAEDRVHRIGQKADSVQAFYLIAEGTIEERICEILDKKDKVVNRILAGKAPDRDSMLTELLMNYRRGK